MAKFIIRAARPDEMTALRRLIVGLAEYEKLAHLVVGSEADLNNALFGPGAHVEAVLLHVTGQSEPAGFALYFHNFSTFLSRRGLYLEDLFVVPAQRGNGYGRALLLYLARLAKERGCGRFEWAVLDWNVNAQQFYEGLGATVLPDWRIVRVTGDALVRMAAEPA